MTDEFELADRVKVKIPEVSDAWLPAEVVEISPVVVDLSPWNMTRMPVVYGPDTYTDIEPWDPFEEPLQ